MAKAKKIQADESAVVEVKKPEDWPEATAVNYSIQLPDGPQILQFDVRALSLGEDIEIQNMFSDPVPPKAKRGDIEVDDLDDDGYQNELAEIEFNKMVATIDKTWIAIPGETIEEKSKCAQEKLWRQGLLKSLFLEILRLSGFSAGEQIAVAGAREVKVASVEDLAKQMQADKIYRLICGKKDLHFTLHGISSLDLKNIEISTDPGPPPLQDAPRRAGRGGGVPTRNPLDPDYRAKLKQCSDERNLLILQAAIGFEIPGKDVAQKIEWLRLRPSGQVHSLLTFIKADVLTYRDKTDFFTAA